jgi:signal transduction histidine kinase/CheY-like chemotaxis protein
MRVQTKIVLLLSVVFATFAAGLAALHLSDRVELRRIAEQEFQERTRSFDEFLKHHGARLDTLVRNHANLDALVAALTTNDQRWLMTHINPARLEAVEADAIWVYRTDGTRIYSVNAPGSAELADVPVPAGALDDLFDSDGRCHFFAKSGDAFMEIRGGTIHPSGDLARTTPPSGFFFAGRRWDKAMLQHIGFLTENEVVLVPPERAGRSYNDETRGIMAFSPLTLRSWDQRPLAQLVVRHDSPIVRELSRSSRRLVLWLSLFAVVLLLLLAVALFRWVSRPMQQMMESLNREDPAPLAPLESERSEFGELARTVRKFFQQRDDLVREMEERRTTAEALRHNENELRETQKMEAVGLLAGGVAHDFNNLLTAIIGYAELIGSRFLNDSIVSQRAEMIRKAGEQAAVLTRHLLAFSRKQLLKPRVIDLNDLVVHMETLLRRVLGERYELETRPDGGFGTVKVDPSQLEQVIINLAVNARDAMPEGGRLTIRTTNVHLDRWQAPRISIWLAEGDYVELSVIDTGTGMDEATKSRIFQPFFTTKPTGKGTGLGLATVYGIVRQTGGGISVESERGKGTTFRIYLPVERAPAESWKRAAHPVDESPTQETVLVVEDEEIVRELVCGVLSEQGYNVMCALDGFEALQKAKEYDGRIHLLVTDVIMPNMNGPELAATLTPIRPDMKVLYVSGYSSNEMGAKGVLDPHVDLLQKPFTPQALARKIREVIEERSEPEIAPV